MGGVHGGFPILRGVWGFLSPWEHVSLQECLKQGWQQASNNSHSQGSHSQQICSAFLSIRTPEISGCLLPGSTLSLTRVSLLDPSLGG